MSGGSWDYVFQRIATIADDLEAHTGDPLRLAMAPHVRRLADAMRAIEWVDSADYSKDQEEAPIARFLQGFGDAKEQVNAVIVSDLDDRLLAMLSVLRRVDSEVTLPPSERFCKRCDAPATTRDSLTEEDAIGFDSWRGCSG